MKMCSFFILILFNLQASAGTYLASAVSCKNWKKKKLATFAQEIELPQFVKDSRAFFLKTKNLPAQKYDDVFGEMFSQYRKISNSSKFSTNYKLKIKPTQLYLKKVIKSFSSPFNPKSMGITMAIELSKPLESINFEMKYIINNEKIDSSVIYRFKDGHEVAIPLDTYISLFLPKSCQKIFQVSKSDYFKESWLKRTAIFKEKIHQKEVPENHPSKDDHQSNPPHLRLPSSQ